uniref:Uncharacterized protein n=1 Tax=Anguilla anguilla TaxID=7936 RepID=A0A0E9VCU5_ANGAN
MGMGGACPQYVQLRGDRGPQTGRASHFSVVLMGGEVQTWFKYTERPVDVAFQQCRGEIVMLFIKLNPALGHLWFD